MRTAIREVFGAASAELASHEERARLILSVPELRMLDSFIETIDMFAAILAERVGRPADDFNVRTMVGAVIGVGISTWFEAGERWVSPASIATIAPSISWKPACRSGCDSRGGC